ncbi:hypothetical protein QQX10_08630 [Demequina sp. SYSU T00039]|uniref:LPXTG-motif cell wall anchor domain-containing protein n=1 Tax=Demequina lignilytica TaxID=3051663 RepID=A0AAW7M9D1_9MICO|nr:MULTISPECIES: hypothetical protein [unclassified Demequina]MDN4477418.1 hypothetical protein [Demequina sp. SYSU T00039-1]MDN4488231.1 hypothetical protein [Demequina sp. SYSU T00039]
MWGRKIAIGVLAGAIVLAPTAAFAAPVYPAPPAPQSGVIPNDPVDDEVVDVDDETEEVVVETKKVTTTTTVVPTLSETGFDSLPMALGAGALLVAGAATVVISARRTSTGTRV